MRQVRLLLVPGLLAVAVASALLLRPAAARGGHTASAVVPQGLSCVIDVWSVVPSPSTSVASNVLTGVSSVSARDVWAVGYNVVPGVTVQSFAEHYNGATWSMVTVPNPSSIRTLLNGVIALATDDVWAVGYADVGLNSQTLIEHWNGTSWGQVPSPNAGTGGALLAGIAAVSASDIWAVGGYVDQNTQYPLFEHWDGRAWSIVMGANTGTSSAFVQTASALSSTNVWAAGYYTLFDGTEQTFVEHWDGTKWSIIPSPNAGTSVVPNSLSGMAAISPNNMWVVGQTTSPASMNNTLAEQWNGTKWSLVSTPNLGSSSSLGGIAAIPGTNQLWAVGGGTNSSGTLGLGLIERWDGTKWSIIPSPNPPSASSGLVSVTVVSASDAWAVGSTTAPPQAAPMNRDYDMAGQVHSVPAGGAHSVYTLIEHYHPLPTGRPCV